MRVSKKVSLLCALLIAVLLAAPAGRAGAERYYYGIEVGGVLCGYSEINKSIISEDGRDLILLEQSTFLMLSALGSKFDTSIKLTYRIDPETGAFVYHDSDVTQGPTKLSSVVHVEGDSVRFSSSTDNQEIATAVSPDVILENTLFFPHLKEDFVDKALEEKTYQIYEVREAELQETTYTKAGTEELELAGNKFSAVILDELNKETGLKLKWWIDTETGHLLKAVHPNNRMSYLADASVVRNIEIANLDDSIFSKTNVRIADIRSISYMKVRASLEPSGLWVTPESLNVPGQSFTGTVEDNMIQGVFEIEHKSYDGQGAPPFPPDFSSDESLKEYVEPGMFIESNDPVLVEKAMEITSGSKDSWEAACRLSKWVGENISYSIPGGKTARKTYDIKSGECGAHSLLLSAFCRSVGIPARVVWGCMYTPNSGGSFGQHGWNEIYVGSAGWIPVDATAMETDYVDSGHIRVGVFESTATALNPGEMEVLDYRVGTGDGEEALEALNEKYNPYVGEYTNVNAGRTLKLAVQDGCLTVDIPGQVLLPFNDPDDQGKWYCRLAGHVFCTFDEDESGTVSEMQLHEIVKMQKQSGPDTTDASVPENLRPYLGKYYFAAVNAQFTVIYREGSLAIEDPLENMTIGLQAPDEEGRWVDEFNKNVASFEFDDEGNVKALVIDAITRFRR